METLLTLETMGLPMLEIGEEAGLRWGVALSPRKVAVNGYVQLTFGHPLYRKLFDEEEYSYLMDDDMIDIPVHGGVTYFQNGIIGFDTMHYRDVWTDQALAEVGGGHDHKFPPTVHSDSIYWTKEAVIEETKRLARHLAEMK